MMQKIRKKIMIQLFTKSKNSFLATFDQNLSEKKFSQKEITSLISVLKERGWLNDAELAEPQIVRGQEGQKGDGRGQHAEQQRRADLPNDVFRRSIEQHCSAMRPNQKFVVRCNSSARPAQNNHRRPQRFQKPRGITAPESISTTAGSWSHSRRFRTTPDPRGRVLPTGQEAKPAGHN